MNTRNRLVEKGHADYLWAIRQVSERKCVCACVRACVCVCVCVCLLEDKKGWSRSEISVGSHSMKRARLPLPLIRGRLKNVITLYTQSSAIKPFPDSTIFNSAFPGFEKEPSRRERETERERRLFKHHKTDSDKNFKVTIKLSFSPFFCPIMNM